MNIKILMVLVLPGLLFACKNNPYPENVDFESLEMSNTRTERTLQKQVMYILAEPVMQFVEGEEGVYKVEGLVPSGQAVLEVDGLPDGASFDPKASEIRWTPDFVAANDQSDEGVIHQEYPVRIRMIDPNNDWIFVEKEVLLVVFDSFRGAIIWTDVQASLEEGKAYKQNVEILSEDISVDHFELFAPDAPNGVSLAKTGPGKYEILFTPQVDFVKSSDLRDNKGFYKEVHFRIQAVSSRGKATVKILRWKVRDKSEMVLVTAPTYLKGIDEVSFIVTLADPNGEDVPILQIPRRPRKGRFTMVPMRKKKGAVKTLSQYKITWKDIPYTEIGSKKKLDFKACGHAKREDSCRKFTVTVEFAAKKLEAPLFNRRAWPLGVVKAQVLGQDPLEVRLPIIDQVTRRNVLDVEIEVSSKDLEVQWSRGLLVVDGKAEGLYQFNVRARSVEGVEALESMIVQVVVPGPVTTSSDVRK